MASVSRSNDLSSRISSRVTAIALSLGLEQRAVRFETEHRAPDRLVVDELQLIVAGHGPRVPRGKLPRALREERRGGGGGGHPTRGGGGRPGGGGEPHAPVGAPPPPRRAPAHA